MNARLRWRRAAMTLQVVAMLGIAYAADLLRPRWKQPTRGSRAVDPRACGHDADAAVPLSGDGWMCGDCGADIPAPKGCEQ